MWDECNKASPFVHNGTDAKLLYVTMATLDAARWEARERERERERERKREREREREREVLKYIFICLFVYLS